MKTTATNPTGDLKPKQPSRPAPVIPTPPHGTLPGAYLLERALGDTSRGSLELSSLSSTTEFIGRLLSDLIEAAPGGVVQASALLPITSAVFTCAAAARAMAEDLERISSLIEDHHPGASPTDASDLN